MIVPEYEEIYIDALNCILGQAHSLPNVGKEL